MLNQAKPGTLPSMTKLTDYSDFTSHTHTHMKKDVATCLPYSTYTSIGP